MNDVTETPAAPNESEPTVQPPEMAVVSNEQLPSIGEPAGEPVKVRGVALGVVATIAFIYVLDWAQAFFISVLLGILLAYTLNPLVDALERIKIPRFIGVPLVVGSFVCGVTYGGYSLRGQADSIIDQLPEAVTKLSSQFSSLRNDPASNIQKVQAAVDQATSSVAPNSPADKQKLHIIIDSPPFKLGNFLWAGSMGLLGFIGQMSMVIFLTFFLLLSGDTFKRKLVKLTGPSLSARKITVHILDDINASIQSYMFMLLVTNGMVWLLSWAAFHLLGLQNAGAWGVTAGLLHVVPYFGPMITALVTGMAAYLQFDSLFMGLAVAGASLAIATFVGVFITTWMTGRIAKMNAAAVFISLLFLAWLWGVWGILLSIPLIVIVKVVSEHVEQLNPLAELLGE